MFFDKQNNEDYTSSFRDLRTKIPKLKRSVFNILSCIYIQQDTDLKENKRQTYLFFLSSLLKLFQISSILFNPTLDIKNWSDFDLIWKISQYSRFDSICISMNRSHYCTIGSLVLSHTMLIVFLFIVFIQHKYKKKQKHLIWLFKKFSILLQLQGFSFICLSFNIVASAVMNNAAEEYQLDLLGLQGFLSFSSVIIFICFDISQMIFGFEFRHYFAPYNINSRASNSICWKSKIAIIFTIILYSFLSRVYLVFYYIGIAIINFVPLIMLYKNQPFYQFRANYLRILPHLFCFENSVVVIVAIFTNSAFFCVLGLFVFSPFSFYFLFQSLKIKNKEKAQIQLEYIQDVHQFELAFRSELFKTEIEDPKEILKKFNYMFYRSSCKIPKIFLLWFTSFCFYNCDKHRLSLIKSSLFSSVPTSIEEEFHDYCFKKHIYKIVESQYFEYKLMYKYRKLDKIRIKDTKTCIALIQFLRNLQTMKENMESLEKQIMRFKGSLKKTFYKYLKICSKYNSSLMVLGPFYSFLQVFKLDNEKCSEIKHKIDFVHTNIKLVGHKLESNYDINPIIIVSAYKLNFGQILFANKPFRDLVNKSIENIEHKQINSFFPESFSFFSVDSLKKFKQQTSDTTKYLKQNLVLQISENSIVEVTLSVVLMSYSRAFYLFSFEQLNLNRDVVVITKQGLIEASTKGINNLISNNNSMKNRNISEILPISLASLKTTESKEINLQHPPFIIQYCKTSIINSKIRFLYIYSSSHSKKNASTELGELITSKKYRKSIMFEQKEVTSVKFMFSPLFISENTPIKTEKKEENTYLVQSNSFSSHSKLKKVHKNSVRFLKCFHWLIIFSAISVTACSIFTMVYMQTEIATILNRDRINVLDIAISSSVQLADYAEFLSTAGNMKGGLIDTVVENFVKKIEVLESTLKNFSSFDNGWQYCGDIGGFFDEDIPAFRVRGNLLMTEFMNNFDFFDMIAAYSKLVLNNFSEKQVDFDEELKFIVLNLFGKTRDYLRNQQKILFKCEEKSIKELSMAKIILIVIGVSVISLCFFVSIALIKKIHANQFLLWKNLIKIANSTSPFIGKCKDRCFELSDFIFEPNEVKPNISKQIKRLKFYSRYISRFFALLLVGALYYVIVYYQYYRVFESQLQSRNQIFKYLSLSKSSITSLHFWQRNLYFYPNDVTHRLKPIMPISQDYKSNIYQEITELKDRLYNLKGKSQYILDVSNMFELLYEKQDSLHYTRKGTVSGVFLWVFDGYYLRSNIMTYDEINSYFLTFIDIENEFENEYELFSKTTKLIIERILKSFINFSCSFFVIYLGFYFIVVRPFIQKEIKCNKTVEFLAEIISEEDDKGLSNN